MPAVCHPCFEHSGKFGKHFRSCWLLFERSSRDASHDSAVLLAELRAGSLDGYGCELFLPLDAVLAQLYLHRLDAISRIILCSRNIFAVEMLSVEIFFAVEILSAVVVFVC